MTKVHRPQPLPLSPAAQLDAIRDLERLTTDYGGYDWQAAIEPSDSFEWRADNRPEWWEDEPTSPGRPVVTTQIGAVERILDEVGAEIDWATDRFPAFNSAHEGFAILLEEIDELWDEVRTRQGRRDVVALRKEAVQVAAMAIRFIHDICDGKENT